MAKKRKAPQNLDKIDLNAIYICDMVVKETNKSEKAEVKFEVAPDNIGYNIIPVDKDRYDTKYFYDVYVDWLLYTKYFVKKEDYICNNPEC